MSQKRKSQDNIFEEQTQPKSEFESSLEKNINDNQSSTQNSNKNVKHLTNKRRRIDQTFNELSLIGDPEV
jgi:hypothetical protein